jgi:hypothetical protein
MILRPVQKLHCPIRDDKKVIVWQKIAEASEDRMPLLSGSKILRFADCLLGHSLTTKMGAVCYSETLVNCYQILWASHPRKQYNRASTYDFQIFEFSDLTNPLSYHILDLRSNLFDLRLETRISK